MLCEVGTRLRENVKNFVFLPAGGKQRATSLLGPKLLLSMGCVKLSEKICVHLPSVYEQTDYPISLNP